MAVQASSNDAAALIASARAQGRTMLAEAEAKAFLARSGFRFRPAASCATAPRRRPP